MDNDKVNEAFRSIADLLLELGYEPHRLAGVELALWGDSDLKPQRRIALDHCYALALAGLELPAEKLGKKFRWLGWIQGVLWSFGLQSIEEQKRANMPDAGK